MSQPQTNTKRSRFLKFCIVAGAVIVSASAGGCIENYGRLTHNAEVTRAFQHNQTAQNYTYYYYGRSNMPYAIIGIDPDYRLQSKIWREVDSDSEQFKEMIFWVWDDPRYHYQRNFTKGADILDPLGRKVGIWYGGLWWAAIRFEKENRLVVMPETPFMGGP